jgi:hypothetical protein
VLLGLLNLSVHYTDLIVSIPARFVSDRTNTYAVIYITDNPTIEILIWDNYAGFAQGSGTNARDVRATGA